MPKIEASVVIDRPVADVYAYVQDASNATLFTHDLVVWEPLTEQRSGVGARIRAGAKVGPATQESTVEIVRDDKDAAIAWESRSGFQQDGCYLFEPAGKRTKVTFKLDLTLPGGIAGRMLGKAVEPVARQNITKTLENLKAILED